MVLLVNISLSVFGKPRVAVNIRRIVRFVGSAHRTRMVRFVESIQRTRMERFVESIHRTRMVRLGNISLSVFGKLRVGCKYSLNR